MVFGGLSYRPPRINITDEEALRMDRLKVQHDLIAAAQKATTATLNLSQAAQKAHEKRLKKELAEIRKKARKTWG